MRQSQQRTIWSPNVEILAKRLLVGEGNSLLIVGDAKLVAIGFVAGIHPFVFAAELGVPGTLAARPFFHVQ